MTLSIWFLLQKWSPKVHKKQSSVADFPRKFVSGSYRQVFQLLIEFSTFITRVGLRVPGAPGRRPTDTLTQAKHCFMIFSHRNQVFQLLFLIFQLLFRIFNFYSKLAAQLLPDTLRLITDRSEGILVDTECQSWPPQRFSTFIRDFSTFIRHFQLLFDTCPTVAP